MFINIDDLRKRKAELGYTNEQIASLTGVPLGTVQKIFGGATKAPRRETYLALAEVLEPELISGRQQWEEYVREEALAYETYEAIRKSKKQGEYTLEDYYAIPDQRRVELIDGVIYDMTAPLVVHQLIAGDVYYQLLECVKRHDMTCLPLIAPVDVQLNCDNKTMVQPDVMILCDRSKLKRKVVYGAPEFVLEVLSPSTRSKDLLVKLKKYKEAKCREVWFVDPDNRRVTVYFFDDNNWPVQYTFEDEIPVGISEGKCVIDFRQVSQRIEILDGVDEE